MSNMKKRYRITVTTVYEQVHPTEVKDFMHRVFDTSWFGLSKPTAGLMYEMKSKFLNGKVVKAATCNPMDPAQTATSTWKLEEEA